MDIELLFNCKSSSINIPKAVRLSEKFDNYSYSKNNKYITLKTNAFDQKFLNILKLVQNIKGTSLQIDGEEVDNINGIYDILRCIRKKYCDGVCIIVNDYEDLLKHSGILKKSANSFYNEYIWERYDHRDIIINWDEEEIIIDKNIFHNHYNTDHAFVKKVCPIYSQTKVDNAFSKMPDNIHIKTDPDIDEILFAAKDTTSTGFDDLEKVNLSEESIKAIGDEFEKRLEKVLSTFLGLVKNK